MEKMLIQLLKVVRLLREYLEENFSLFFKTVTSDKDSEFIGLHEALQDAVVAYFNPTYTLWKRGPK